VTSSRTSRLAIAAILFSTAFVAMAQTRSRDSYRLLRYDEDYSHLCNDKNEAVKTIKCIPLGPGRYLSLGGEERLKYERYSRSGWGAAPEDRDGYLLQR